jgi:hypothetical protein
MAGIYKTPGVYVEEIPKFPPSIAPVETAIPAFIGYTEKAIRNGESLTNRPTRIESIAEYEEVFGKGPSQDVTIYLDNSNNFVKGEPGTGSNFYLYDSLRMFYANGGGKCYIVSVGNYRTQINKTGLEAGLLAIEEEDEPTIILMPDAVAISDLYDLQQTALKQCNKLMDRVVVCDLVNAKDSQVFKTNVDAFRNGIGINYLKYGMAYGPWVNANLPRTIRRKNLTLRRDGTNDLIELESLTNDDKVKKQIQYIKDAEVTGSALIDAANSIVGGVFTVPAIAVNKTLKDVLQAALDGYKSLTESSTSAQLSSGLQKFTDLTFDLLKSLNDVKTGQPTDQATTEFKILNSINSYLQSNPGLKESIEVLIRHHKKVYDTTRNETTDLESVVVINPKTIDSTTNFAETIELLGITGNAGSLNSADTTSIDGKYTATMTDKERADEARKAAYVAVQNAIAMYNSMQSSVNEFEKSLNDSLTSSFGKFKELVTKGAEALNALPPSGAIAGVYAATDRERGVWKAPANVSLSNVIAPVVKISHEQQAEYNVDVNAGKSVNIIRSFTGKGTLVWGARTLAGNDNEWRYVNVRRFFNFVEESTKKATEQFVFEPNDANTWVRVQGMIENFLTYLWRQGALQGIKPEHAFYVAVGLGKTMTAVDILEGRMIVEIGMAVVRPAEFIILKFSHKMAES